MTQLLLNHLIDYTKKNLENKSYCWFNGFDEAYKLLSLLLSKTLDSDTLIVAKNDEMASDIYKLALSLNMTNALWFPSMQVDPYHNLSPNKSILHARMHCLSNLYLREQKHFIVITTFSATLHKIIPKKFLADKFLKLHTNQNIKLHSILEFLKNTNYYKVAIVNEVGTFANRGDILDVATNNNYYRIDFFDDTIDKIRIFDGYSQKTIQQIENLIIYPPHELLLNTEQVNNFKYYYKIQFGDLSYKYLEDLEHFIPPKGLHNFLPLMHDKTDSILNYTINPQIIQIGSNAIYSQVFNDLEEKYNYLIKSKKLFNNDTNLLPPKDLLLNPTDLIIQMQLNHTQSIVLLDNNPIAQMDGVQYIKDNTQMINHHLIILRQQYKKVEDVLTHYLNQNHSDRVVILYNTESFKSTILNCINKNNLTNISLIQNDNIKESFILFNTLTLNDPNEKHDNITILTQEQLSGIKKHFNTNITKRNFLTNLSLFSIGDILVHRKHGFGKYKGIKTLNINNTPHDFLELEYKDNETLYIPVENIDILSRYATEDASVILDKLGSVIFQNKQGKIKEKIKDIAYDLIKLAANRNLKTCHELNIDSVAYANFCNKFPYVLTNDQEAAITDVINDFLSTMPSDRLICGDVGFGKTEVAIRAAFLVSNSGLQVLIIAPTTLLCNQHYHNFTKRFQDTAINIKQLSRFVSIKDKKQIKEDLKAGKVDILIATHAALAKDVKFKEVGLIVIDEEQNFGVVHKEKLKTFSEKAHILTLSATPIPRTIQQAFKGIKDLSLIATPPINKLPINTHIVPFELLILKAAIDRELKRQGQIFIVCPRISDIDDLSNSLLQIYPQLSYVIAHGQMSTDNLENAMIDFQNKKYDVLLSTSIIESGLDLKNVNTIIIHNADMFGLAQLYQIRGRVGRGDVQSYAYLLYDDKKHISELAKKRLSILQNLDYLGASFALASYDLDLRGAGNLLGEEQSGHIKEIGYDLYQKFLEQEINNLNNQQEDNIIYNNFSPTINTNVPVLIPKTYINDMEVAIEMYQTLGNISELSHIITAKEEMHDRFGKIPPQLENLFDSIELKILSKKAYVERITFGNKGILVEFYEGKFPKVEDLLNYIAQTKGEISLKPQGGLIINQINPTYDTQLKKIKSFLFKLHDILLNKTITI